MENDSLIGNYFICDYASYFFLSCGLQSIWVKLGKFESQRKLAAYKQSASNEKLLHWAQKQIH